MNYKTFILSVGSCLFILMLFRIEAYETWFHDRIYALTSELQDDIPNMDLNSRKRIRWGGAYVETLKMKHYFDSLGLEDPLILLPEPAYVKKFMPKAHIPEPIVFYYFSGLRTTYPSGKQAGKTDIALVPKNGELRMETIHSQQQLDTILNIHK